MAYNAFDRQLQLWVAACLYVGLEDIHVRLHGPIDGPDADQLYRSAATLGTTLQVRDEDWPADRASFQHYWDEGLRAVVIDETVREHLDDVVGLRYLPRPIPDLLGPVNRFVTAGFLPPACREQMRYGWRPADQRRFDAAMGVLFALDRLLPGPLRRFPFNVLLRDCRRRAARGVALA